ncbi:MAG TPA: hypothetical protein VMV36_02330 [Ignavibacteriaceae bacterium]|nr:hypothetical protein [Ignavibacteriaceae bacterium]
MKVLKNNATLVILFLMFILSTLFFNLVLGISPILDFFNYMASKKYLWTIPLLISILFGFWLYSRSMKRKISNERIEIFNATIRTIQDILQNSASSMQLLILDMKDVEVHEEIIIKAEKNMDELKSVIKTLASVDPKTIQLKDLNRNLSIIKMND